MKEMTKWYTNVVRNQELGDMSVWIVVKISI